MSQQGERPAAHEDDWWRRLYDETARDTGATNAADSLDDRFDSVSDAVSPDGRGGIDRAGERAGEPVAVPSPVPSRVPPLVPSPIPTSVTSPVSPSSDAPGARVEPPPQPSEVAPSEVAGSPSSPPAPAPVPVVPRPLRERAPWEPPAVSVRAPGAAPAGPPQPRTFATPPVPAEPPAAADLPSAPDQPPLPPQPAQPPQPPEPSVAAGASAPVPPLPRRPVAGRTVAPQAPVAEAAARAPGPEPASVPAPRPVIGHVGDRPPTYDAEPTALPATVPQELDGLVADTVLDGARYGTYTLRAASVRGDSARFRGEPRRDALLTVRFGTDRSALVLVAVATGARATERAHLAAADACRSIGAAVGRSHVRLSEDIRAGRRGDLKSGLHRLTDRSYGKLRARAAELGLEPEQYTAGLRCLLLPADPDCRTRIFFGVGPGGLFRLRDGVWQDLEPEAPEAGVADADADGAAVVGFGSRSPSLSLSLSPSPSPTAGSPSGPPARPAQPFRFRASVARPGDTLLLCSTGLAEPLRGEPALARELAERWTPDRAPGLAAFLTDSQLRVKGYSDDRTSAAVWEA
ncbi:protein phosphatase 2C domain-containing protein [Streptomyces sp. NPDC087845]|uniref:protein phosphatase 2C domain-containing protein n=1 Tax=Streptomyces sp. NPDC087845 TaxID=3365806 RepID=UPI003829AB58